MSAVRKGKVVPLEVEYKIEKGVPIPPPRQIRTKLNVARMEVGDSILVPLEEYSRDKLTATAGTQGMKFGMKFRSRKEGDATRLWRSE